MFLKNIILSNKLKNFAIIAFLLFCFVIINACSYVTAVSQNISSSVFRLHVIANSDSADDQNLKYIVRDGVLEYVKKSTKGASNKQELMNMIDLDKVQEVAQQIIYDNGYIYPVSVEIGYFEFPTKIYGDISLPAGFYDALRIKIGNATGQNWWCVMFPPLCFVDVSSGIVPDSSKAVLEENLEDEEYALVSEDTTEVKFKFKIIEFFQNVSIALGKK